MQYSTTYCIHVVLTLQGGSYIFGPLNLSPFYSNPNAVTTIVMEQFDQSDQGNYNIINLHYEPLVQNSRVEQLASYV